MGWQVRELSANRDLLPNNTAADLQHNWVLDAATVPVHATLDGLRVLILHGPGGVAHGVMGVIWHLAIICRQLEAQPIALPGLLVQLL